VRKEQAIESLLTHMKVRFETAEDDPWLMGVLVGLAPEPRRATSIEQLLLPWNG
jgi:calcineurin-like phosphoesterase